MKVLLVHGFYREHGGEAVVYEMERRALEDAGVSVVEFTRHNDEIGDYGALARLSLPLRTVWAWDTQRALGELLERERPALAHFTNILPLISPAAYATCQRHGTAVLQALHNYRFACPAATFLRDGKVCEECPRFGLQRSVRYGCYRGSRAASACVASMLKIHRTLGTFERAVDLYTAPTHFTRQKLIETAGLPAERVRVRPNFLASDPGVAAQREGYALFAGRLVDYKGILTLLAAAELPGARPHLKIVGGGPLEATVRGRVDGLRDVELLGPLPHADALTQIKRAGCLIFPSECYEGMPTVILEAFACGVPVIASRLGAMAELVRDGDTGLLFTPGDARDLREKLELAFAQPALLSAMGTRARAEFEARYSFRAGQRALLAAYRDALARRSVGAAAAQQGWDRL